jgi:pyruvate-formate lyase-activating enzyme
VNLKKYQSISRRDYEAMAGPDWPEYNQFQQHKSVESFVYAEIDQMLTGPKKFNSQVFCVLPFYGIELPKKTACCLLPANHDLAQIKQDMLNNRRNTACNKCWALEDAGFQSDRLIKNDSLDFYTNLELGSLFAQCQQGKNATLHYKIDTSNTCNSTCVTCNSFASSLWGQLESRNGVVPYQNWSLLFDQVSGDIDFDRAISLVFRGGEPLLSATNFKILQQLIKHKNTDCFVSFTTNGSVELTQKQKDTLAQFSNINVCFSIDGLGPVFEYLRYPLKWNQILKNLEYYKTHNIDVSVSFTVSNLNVLYFDEIVNWFDQHQIRYLVNPVYNPEHFGISALPKSLKTIIQQKVNHPEINNLLGTHSEKDDVNYQTFRTKIAQQDSWKGISIKNYLPELIDLLD